MRTMTIAVLLLASSAAFAAPAPPTFSCPASAAEYRPV